jgi:SHS2 domain-containing protein
MVPRHAFEEHTGDLRARVEGTTVEEVLAEAGRALAAVLAGPGILDAEPSGPAEAVSLDAPDPAALLVDWLNELLYLSETRKRVYTRFSFEVATPNAVRASVRGSEPDGLRTQVKAATLHGARVEREGDGLVATVVLDV